MRCLVMLAEGEVERPGPVNGRWPWVLALAGAYERLTRASMEHDIKRLIDLLKLEKWLKNTASDGIGSNFSGTAFCMHHQLVGILFR